MTRPRTRYGATNILWGLLCVAVIPVTSAAAQSSERGARLFSRVRAVSTASGVVLNRQDIAALAALARTAATVEVEWPGKSGQVTSVRMSAILERVQFELALRLSIQPASARHLLMSVDVKVIEALIERALVEEIRYAGGPAPRPGS